MTNNKIKKIKENCEKLGGELKSQGSNLICNLDGGANKNANKKEKGKRKM